MSFLDQGGRRGPQQPPLPKPYDFVPLPGQAPRRSVPAGHHRYHAGRLNGSLTAILVARSPVHVASGNFEPTPNDRQYPLVKAMFRVGGVPAIPATSLKGCFRSIAEAITRSAVQVTQMHELDRAYQPSRRPEQDGVDRVQNMFGTLGYQGLIRLTDAKLIEGRTITVPTPQLFRPRSDSVGTYTEQGRPRGRKFYMHGQLAKGNLPLEACAAGSTFRLHLDFENLTSGEVGLLLMALGLGEPRWWPKLGGGKPACLGTIEVTEPALIAYEPQTAYRDFAAPTDSTALIPLLNATRSEGLILDEPARKLAEILRWPREDRNCPDRSY